MMLFSINNISVLHLGGSYLHDEVRSEGTNTGDTNAGFGCSIRGSKTYHYYLAFGRYCYFEIVSEEIIHTSENHGGSDASLLRSVLAHTIASDEGDRRTTYHPYEGSKLWGVLCDCRHDEGYACVESSHIDEKVSNDGMKIELLVVAPVVQCRK